MLFAFALETVQKPPCFSTNTAFHLKLVHSRNFSICTDFLEKTWVVLYAVLNFP